MPKPHLPKKSTFGCTGTFPTRVKATDLASIVAVVVLTTFPRFVRPSSAAKCGLRLIPPNGFTKLLLSESAEPPVGAHSLLVLPADAPAYHCAEADPGARDSVISSAYRARSIVFIFRPLEVLRTLSSCPPESYALTAPLCQSRQNGQRARTEKATRSAQSQRRVVRNASSIAITASVITPVASQPRFFRRRLTVKRPMISGRAAISIITAMMGTEITPLITALQISALTGSIAVKLSATPIVVAAMRMP